MKSHNTICVCILKYPTIKTFDQNIASVTFEHKNFGPTSRPFQRIKTRLKIVEPWNSSFFSFMNDIWNLHITSHRELRNKYKKREDASTFFD